MTSTDILDDSNICKKFNDGKSQFKQVALLFLFHLIFIFVIGCSLGGFLSKMSINASNFNVINADAIKTIGSGVSSKSTLYILIYTVILFALCICFWWIGGDGFLKRNGLVDKIIKADM